MRRRPARTRSSGLVRIMVNQQSLLLRSLEHLTIAQSCRPKRQGRLITLRPSMPPFSRRPIRQPRIQRTTPLAPRSRSNSRKRTVRRPHNRTSSRKRPVRRPRNRTRSRKRTVRRPRSRILGRSPVGMSLLSGHRLLRRASGRSPSTPLLLQKRGLRRSNNTRSPRRRSRKSRSRKRRSNRRKSQKKTRSRRSNDRAFVGIKLGCNSLGILSFHGVPSFTPPSPRSTGDGGVAIMAAKLAEVDDRILARMEEAAALRAGSIIARGSKDKPQTGRMQFDCGYLSPYFITDPERMQVAFENVYILIHEKKISFKMDLLPLLAQITKCGKPLLIIAEEVEGEALATLVVNKLRGSLQVAAVKAPGLGDQRKSMLHDIARHLFALMRSTVHECQFRNLFRIAQF